jgi:hypothetical protein
VYAYETYLTAAVVLFVLWRWGAETLRGTRPETAVESATSYS